MQFLSVRIHITINHQQRLSRGVFAPAVSIKKISGCYSIVCLLYWLLSDEAACCFTHHGVCSADVGASIHQQSLVAYYCNIKWHKLLQMLMLIDTHL